MLSPLLAGLSTGALLVIERFGWWFHIVGILAFAVYVTYSKHLHIFLSFPNTYFKSEEPVGRIANMPDVTREVNIMLGFASDQGAVAPEGKKFGAKDVTDLSWKNLMDAYSCTECGRCTASCPANLTGKKLSPRKIMMDTRDRAEELGEYRMVGIKDPKIEANTLLDQYISREEILACTTCNACVEACPVNINPLDIIVQLRRFSVMEESSAPGQWNAMFANLENNMAPWKFAPSDRANWIEKVNPNT
jgi:heterodisulfide reductase subunit C